jgi:hypothetical protein
MCVYSLRKFHYTMIFLIIGIYVGLAYWTLLASYYAPRTQGLFILVMGNGSAIYGVIKYEEAESRMEEEASVLIGSLFIA